MNQNLNEAQKKAIMHFNGPMMALAGPGSGKTLVITRRIENLIKNEKVDASHILVITFTKSAANEMKERFFRRMQKEAGQVTFGTFHAVFFKILKHAYHFEASNIIREEERIRFMQEMIYAMKLDYEDEAEWIKDIFSEISMVKNRRIRLENYYPVHCGKDVFSRIFQEYQKFLRQRRKIDFDDMLVYTYELFVERSDILSAWQNKYRYILIDEFQDVNQLQYEIVRMLANPRQNLFIVGDDDQSIYRFRGANPEIMLHVPRDYQDLEMVSLDCNYRCPRDVVQMADRLISHNRKRFPKEISAAKTQGDSITTDLLETQQEEYTRIVQRIQASDTPLSQIAVLFRTNTQSRLLTERLMEYNIPFTVKDKAPGIYEHWIARDMFAYIRIAMGSRSRKDFLMIMNRPRRYISRESLSDETVAFQAWQAFYSDQPWMEERIETLQRDILAIRDMRPFAAMNYIRKAVGYDEFLVEYARDRKIEKEGLAEIIDALQESSRTHASFKEWFDHIEQYQQELEASLKQERTEKEAVTLATFHSAKGLEFDTVHIIDVNEGITPYKKAVLPADMEEERRMFYVGITRARKKLYLYVLKKIHHHDVEASRFLTEMRRQSSSNSASSNNSSNFSSTASNSSSSKIFSRDGLPSSSSK